jgi:hypothetical protein
MLNKSLTQMFTKIISPPAAAPWTALPAINIPILLLTAHTKLPIANTATAASNTGFRPQISDNFAQIGPAAALDSRYADPTHVYPEAE